MKASVPTDSITQMKQTNSLIYILPKLTQKEIDHLKRLASMKEMESVNDKLPNKKHQTQMSSLMNLTKHLSVLYNIFQKTKQDPFLTDSMRQTLPPRKKTDKDILRNENYQSVLYKPDYIDL